METVTFEVTVLHLTQDIAFDLDNEDLDLDLDTQVRSGRGQSWWEVIRGVSIAGY